MIYQPEVGFLVCIPLHHCQGVIDRMENASKSDVVGWQGKDMVMEPMVMKEVQGVICYNSFPLSFYSPNCSLLSPTYLER